MGTAKFSGAHLWLRTSSLSDCFYRTVVGAGAAVDALVRIDYINITGRDCLYRTFLHTCSAAYTFRMIWMPDHIHIHFTDTGTFAARYTFTGIYMHL